MARIGLVLMLVCVLTGGLFYMWTSSHEKPPVAAASISPPARPVEIPAEAEAKRDVDFGPYMADLQRRIKQRWSPPKAHESDRIQVVFKVHENGMMSNLRLSNASGKALADRAALRAVQDASPFRPLPAGSPKDVDIQFTFDYNVHKGKGSASGSDSGSGSGTFRRF